MTRTIRWSRTAIQQLAAIRRYVAQDKPIAANRLALRIKNSVNTLANFPDSGRAGFIDKTRQWVIPGAPYIATYAVDADEVRVLSLHHGMTNWTAGSEKHR